MKFLHGEVHMIFEKFKQVDRITKSDHSLILSKVGCLYR